MRVCSITNKEVVDDYIEFKCPACNKGRIVRSFHSRKVGMPYVCSECGFEGP